MAERSDHTARRGARSVVHITIGQLAATAISLVSAVLIPRVLSPDDFGTLSTVLAVLVFTQQLTGFGIAIVGFRFVGPRWFGGEPDKALHIASNLWSCMLATSLLSAVIAFFWLKTTKALGFGVAICLLLAGFCFSRNAFMLLQSLFIPIARVGTQVTFELVRLTGRLILILALYTLSGLHGVFLGLAIFTTILLGTSFHKMRTTFPIKLQTDFLRGMRPYWRYSVLTYLGGLGVSIQMSFSVYVVAIVASVREAAFLAIAMQAVSILRGLSTAAMRVLMPIFAEFDMANHKSRFLYWGGFVLRANMAMLSFALLGWIIIGRHFIRVVLTDQYKEVYQLTIMTLAYLLIYLFGFSQNRLVNIKGYAGYALIADMTHLLATVAGYLWVATTTPDSSTIYNLLIVNIVAASVYAVGSTIIFRWVMGDMLRITSGIALCLPALVALPMRHLAIDLAPSIGLCTLACVGYSLFALIFIRPTEIQKLLDTLKKGRQ